MIFLFPLFQNQKNTLKLFEEDDDMKEKYQKFLANVPAQESPEEGNPEPEPITKMPEPDLSPIGVERSEHKDVITKEIGNKYNYDEEFAIENSHEEKTPSNKAEDNTPVYENEFEAPEPQSKNEIHESIEEDNKEIEEFDI
eukprot:TRINITY_DN28741_c0_g1_i2.p2 TRINITY_DN28741_c0_g1~~TRINITY_DN28741_c0_g1_i2.p2  ORF type:complete len:141 (+),score=34.97 TRINITY_DN28741_c0_g1_i2:59-481(+)